jgi:PAS domain S-box-containing protein
MRLLGRRVHGVDVAASLYAAAFFAWLAIRTPGTSSAQFVGVAAFYPLGLAVAWADWRTSRVAGLDSRTRAAWMLLALSAFVLSVSGTAWDIYLRLVGPDLWPGWIDHLELAHGLLGVAAFLLFPGRTFDRRSRARVLLDAGLIVIAGFVLALYFGLRLWFTNLPGESIGWAITSPGVDWLAFVIAAIGSMQKRDRGTRVALLYFVAAGTTYLVANYYFSTAAFGRGESAYRPGDAVDGLWFGAWVLRWLAARVARGRYLTDLVAARRSEEQASSSYESSGFSYLVVAGSFVLLTSQVFAEDERFLGLLALSSALMIGLLLARQLVELRENDRLLAARLAQEARFRSLVQHSSDVVLVVEAGGTVSFASPTADRVFGAAPPVGAGTRFADLFREDDRAALASIFSGASGPRHIQLHVPAADGQWREVEARWNDLRADPSIEGIVVNCRDVTARNELERQLRHAQKLDAVGRLAGGLAHDLNNVLAIVGGYTELLRGELEPGSAAIDDLGHIQQAVDRAAAVTRRVLAFSRRQPAQPTVLDLNAVVRDLLPMLQQSVTAKVEIRLRLEPGLWPVRADQGQMEQVLVNLAANARDAMPDGGVLDIQTARRVVVAGSPGAGGSSPGDYVALSVADSGHGISPEVRERIFEPFFTTKTGEGGMGLGLAMVHGIVRDAGGRIEVESGAGRGAAFTVLLPRSEGSAPVARSRDAGLEGPSQPRTVLLVDDEDNVRVVARRILERCGYRVVEAANGHEAVGILETASEKIDVLLTDLVMPGLHGRQLIARCERLRPSLPIVCMTGYAGEGDDPHEYGSNLVALLSKPFTSEVLRRAVAAAVSARSSP